MVEWVELLLSHINLYYGGVVIKKYPVYYAVSFSYSYQHLIQWDLIRLDKD